MKVKLTLRNRILAFGMLANTQNASLADWRIINDAMLALGISQKDRKLYKIQDVDGDKSKGVEWKNIKEAEKEKEYEIPERAMEIIKSDLKKKDKTGTLPREFFPLADQLIGEE